MQHTSKYTVILLTALASLASCSENDMPNHEKATDKYIVFGAPSLDMNGSVGDFSDNTRANATLTNSVDEFKVWAYCIPNKITGDRDPEKATTRWVDKYMFFTKGADVANLKGAIVTPSSTYNYNGGILTKWNSDPEALYTFIGIAEGNKNSAAFTCTMENASAVSGEEHGPKINITLNTTNKKDGSGKNSKTYTDRSKQNDPLVAAVFDQMRENGKVKLTFHHIMTALRFKIQNFSDQKLTIKSMIFEGQFFNKATLDFSSTAFPPKMTVGTSTYNGNFDIIDINTTQEIAENTAAYAGGEDNYLLLIPNPEGTISDNDGKFVLGKDMKITIKYRFDGDEIDRTPEPIKINLSYLPQPNTKHTAYFNFVGNNFYVTFQADEKTWENGSDNEYTIQ